MVPLMLGFAAAAYAVDVIVRPSIVASDAVAYARSRRKPVINIGAGTEKSSLRTLLFGPTLWGDVNLDLAAAPGVPCGPRTVCKGDALDLSRWPDKYFGSAIASHVLEHVPDPSKMLREMARVAERVYVIVPPVWAPHALLYWDHQWQVADRHACPTPWNRRYRLGRCMPLPYSLCGASRGDFR